MIAISSCSIPAPPSSVDNTRTLSIKSFNVAFSKSTETVALLDLQTLQAGLGSEFASGIRRDEV